MRDGLPGVVVLVVSFPTNFVKSSPYFTITNLTVKILTNCHNLLQNPLHWPICVFRKWIPHQVKVWRDCAHNIVFFPLSQVPIRGCLVFVSCTFSVVVPDATGVELFFVSRTSSGSDPCACFYTALAPSPTPHVLSRNGFCSGHTMLLVILHTLSQVFPCQLMFCNGWVHVTFHLTLPPPILFDTKDT
jgi:hypothetical protein